MAVEKLIVDHIDTWTTALQTRSTAGRGSSGKIDLYGIKKLRELILELAVRGKLVPQDPNDEPASELLKRIAAEKAELVKQGKIKKQKPLPEISEEEKPFELPEGWEWARLPRIYIPQSESSHKVKSSDIIDEGRHPVIEQNAEFISGYSNNSELLININNPVIIFGDHTRNIKYIDFDFIVGADGVKILSPVIINEKYFYWQLKSFKIESRGYSRHYKMLNEKLFSLPPLCEQIRIVTKVEELMSLCDQLEQHSLTSLDTHQQLVETLLTTLTDSQNADQLAENWSRISEHFDTLFTTEASIDALKQTILQLAVMGKLVPQDPNDEPASELLKRIAQEKAQLVKDGKMKKQKPLPPISDEEKPFELPDGWEWVKLGNILHDIKYGTSQKCDYNISGYPVLRIPNIVKGIIDLADIKYGALTDSELKDLTLNKNDLLFIRSNGSTNIVGQSTLVQHDLKDHAYAGYIIRVRLHNEYINARYINMVMKSNLIREQIEGPIRTTTGVKNINSNELMGLLVPLPPKNEQGIIIKKINEIDTTLSNLKVSIQSAQQTQVHLADALTDAAIN
ncbi:restriction endonuclease subunit S [Salmonella enterica]|nr:restriction endonuclease subunit S [Salmonella enterica]EIN2208986.1 restriction endonuclease subunit S [Salmonella enterica subsp. enterica serovar Bovismorbificans]EII0416218.1 restriction endonuclease subunit S [Salmonella enterica]EIN6763487.1 restriction endonuclease subunit S [Salmonella enterica subsp. enterica serovar Bovismorbificans]EIN7019624.1 restriction endonuclease subunit S [Salmonella enterica subsp. enterica serovar Bovismorbificans]